jgi:hypothetical protein
VAVAPPPLRCRRPTAVSPPEGLPEPVAKALNAVQQAAVSAAESAIASAQKSAQAAMDELAAMPQRALESA